VTCHLGSVAAPDLGTVEALCRLRMSVVHMGFALRLIEATPELEKVLIWCGLEEALGLVGEGETEEREETLGVEEEVEPGDPTV
jgi:hypothetical protein